MSKRSPEAGARRRAVAIRFVLPCSLLAAALLLSGARKTGTEPEPADHADWLSSVQQSIAEKEYQASRNDVGLQAPNRAHNLRTYFDGSGIRVHDRTAEGSPQLLGLSLVGVGRGERISPVSPGEVTSEGARVEIRRPDLVEWYVNAPVGLEQGFTLEAEPEGDGDVTVELSVAPGRASLEGKGMVFRTPTGRRLEYGHLAAYDAQGDPVGARFEVPSEGRLQIVLAAGSAVYPVTLDPLLTSTADSRLESNQFQAQMGYSVSGAGDVNGDGYADVVVGAHRYDAGQTDEGAAFVFLGSAPGIVDGHPATAHAQLESDQADARLGYSVSGAGDVNGDGYADVIVGAQYYDAGLADEGAAFVFLGSASGITGCVGSSPARCNPAAAHAQLESDQADALLGVSVSGAGDVNGDGYADVIVGAQRYEAGQYREGAAFVFLGSASGIADGNSSTAHAQLESDQGAAYLGSSVSEAGDVNADGYADVIVGAWSYGAGQDDEGSAFVFLGSASGIADGNASTAHARLESDQADARLGYSVSGAGDVNGDGYADVIVGAYRYDDGLVDKGAAFVFLGSASGIADGNSASAAAQLESDQADAYLGVSVSGAGDVNGDGYADVIVGAYAYDAGQTDEGAAFVFLGSDSGISGGYPATAHAQLESDQADAFLGLSVSGAGDVNGDGYADVIVGSYAYDAGQTDEGAAFVSLGGAQGVADGNPATAHARLVSGQASAYLGRVSGAGDVNGDGYADVIVGASSYDAGENAEGAAFLFLGSASGIADGSVASAAAQLESDQVGASLGLSVSGAGDVNGDGYADVIVGAYNYDAGENAEGAAFVFLGSASGIADCLTTTPPRCNPSTAHAQIESDDPNALLGYSVSGAGDVNGDGYADVIVGARQYSAGQHWEGAAFVFLGSASGVAGGTPASAHARLESDQVAGLLGYSVSGAGDVNGDGYADVIVGAPAYGAGQHWEGAAFVFLGGASGIADGNSATAHAQLESDQEDARLGWSVSGAGDVNGDGYADVIVGAQLYDDGQVDEGAAFVFLGSASGIADGNSASATAQLESDQADANLGYSVSGAGDVNGDGYADVIVGAYRYDAGLTDEGAAFVFLGGPLGIVDGIPATASARLESNQAEAWLGVRVSAAGDVNGDGYADVIVGATGYDVSEFYEGAAFIFLGNDGSNGRLVLPRQLRGGGDSTPVQPWCLSYDPKEFQVEMQATHPGGRGRVKLEIETCSPGIPFDDPNCVHHVSSSWTDVTATSGGVTLTETVDNLAHGELYRWRARVLYAPFSVTQPGITPPLHPAHGPWRRFLGQVEEADVATLDPDTDDDGVCDGPDPEGGICTAGPDNCITIANAGQADGDADLVGDMCDNCIAMWNGAASYPSNRTTTGGQLDDDADGYGNLCDAKFTPGPIVTALDTIQYKTAINKFVAESNCGTSGTEPCDKFDLDGSAPVITALDTIAYKAMLNQPVGPKCAACGVDWVALPCVGDRCGSTGSDDAPVMADFSGAQDGAGGYAAALALWKVSDPLVEAPTLNLVEAE